MLSGLLRHEDEPPASVVIDQFVTGRYGMGI